MGVPLGCGKILVSKTARSYAFVYIFYKIQTRMFSGDRERAIRCLIRIVVSQMVGIVSTKMELGKHSRNIKTYTQLIVGLVNNFDVQTFSKSLAETSDFVCLIFGAALILQRFGCYLALGARRSELLDAYQNKVPKWFRHFVGRRFPYS